MRLLAIDGNSIMNRAYYGIRLLSNHKGIYTNAIFGFMNIYLKHVTDLQPDAIAVAFDVHTPTFRHQKVSSYKANRKGMPEELAMQMPYIKKLLTLLGVQIVECAGYEADDILGTLSVAVEQQGGECVILSGDRDTLQLITDKVHVRLVTNREDIDYTVQRFREEYGFYPSSMVDLKAFMGDSSDNITGVVGIGPKTASTLIRSWGTVEEVYAHIDQLNISKMAVQKLISGKENALESKWLATIVKDAPISTELQMYLPKPIRAQEVRDLLMELEMVKLLDKLHLEATSETVAAEQTVCKITPSIQIERNTLTEEILQQWQQQIDLQPLCYQLDLEQLCLQVLQENTVYETTDEALIQQFLGSAVPKRTFSAKLHYRYMIQHGGMLEQLRSDGEIAAYLLNPASSEYTVARLSVSYHILYDTALESLASLLALPALFDAMEQDIAAQDMEELYQMELQLTRVLATMEESGVLVDAAGLKHFGVYLTEQMEELQQMVYDAAGHPFKIGSPKQLGEVLFGEQKLPHGKKTKTGYSTNAEILESLRDQYPIVDNVLKWRQVSKLKSTYIDGLQKTIAADGRIHTFFKQTETRTGRISSVEPNMQNIPVRTELGSNMRKFFIAGEGNVLLDADYSQIELRILANLCGDTAMQEAFLNGADIHTATAAQVFGMPPEMVTDSMRSAAKAVNFGILYGMGAFSLSKDIHVSVAQADQYIKNYLARYPRVAEFMEKTVEEAKEQGYVSTYFKRRRPVPELRQSNKMIQASGKRIAMNTPIQGTAADIIKIAMIRVSDRLQAECPEAKLILQVHDELIVEVPEALADTAAMILKEEMEHVVQFAVPLTVEVKKGKSWYDAKG
ncbi:MAG: DNA polymerase I [Oscillospiraceae bacterium]|nr:DNA polymerase I [Oscillospiraceae bacterium]